MLSITTLRTYIVAQIKALTKKFLAIIDSSSTVPTQYVRNEIFGTSS